MPAKLLRLGFVLVLTMLGVGCQAKDNTTTTGGEELRLLTQEQVQKLFDQAERTEPKEVVRQSIKNDKGVVIGTATSQTTVIYLKPSSGHGGGRFSVNTTCTSSCSGIPTVLDPSNPNNTCGNPTGCEPDHGTCTACSCAAGCTASCTKTSTGYGNFGGFIAANNPH